MQTITAPISPSFPAVSAAFAANRPSDVRFGKADASPGFQEMAAQSLGSGMRYMAISNIVSALLGPAVARVIESVFNFMGPNRFMKDFYEILPSKKLQSIGFEQVVGHERAKQELKAFLKRQEYPDLFQYLHKHDPRGANSYLLFVGPPGTGKTMLAKAVASQLKDTAFVNLHCDNLVQLMPGTGPKNLAKLEKKLRRLPEKRIVIFLDEVDSLGSRNQETSLNSEDYKTLTRLLKMLDGIKGLSGKELLVIGASNEPEQIDGALRNRFHQIINVPAPNDQELAEMYRLYLQQKELTPSCPVDMDSIVQASQGFTGRKVEQAITILQGRALLNLPKEKLDELNQIAKQNKIKWLKPSKLEPPKIELTYTQQDLLNAIEAVRSNLDPLQAIANRQKDPKPPAPPTPEKSEADLVAV
jgi:SpoVK/Ycf46/Vps4 family AAA+-type ATPase